MDLGTLFAFGMVLVPVVIGTVEAVKRVAGLDERFAPLVALVVSEALTFAMRTSMTPVLEPTQAAVAGLVVALSACGLYSGTRATIAK